MGRNEPAKARAERIRLLHLLTRATLGPAQLIHRGQDLQPGPPSRLIASCLKRVSAHRSLQFGIGPVLVEQQLGAPVGVKLIHAALPC